MSKLYQRTRSKYWYAIVDAWDQASQQMVRKRVSTGTLDKDQAALFADALESTARAARSLAGKAISKDHAHSLFISLLSSAGISIEGNDPFPDLRESLTEFMEWRRLKISPGSFLTYSTSHRKFLAWLDEINVRSPTAEWLTPERVEEYYAWMNRSLALKSSREHIKWLGRAMKRVVEKSPLQKNPVDSLELDTKGTTLDRLPFTLPEATTLIDYLTSTTTRNREWARLVALSLMSGCRLEDAINMDQNALSDGVLTYKQSKTGKSIACPLVVAPWLELITETGSGPVAPSLKNEFLRWGNAKTSTEFTGLVSDAGVEQKFTEFKNGRKVARKTFHSLRHTLRTAIVSSGGSDAQADIVLGHSEGEGKRYTHSEIEAMRGTLEKALRV